MVLFNCDYHEGAHPAIMERMMATNMEQTVGYGEDGHCAHAKELIRRAVEDSSVDSSFPRGRHTDKYNSDSGITSPVSGRCDSSERSY